MSLTHHVLLITGGGESFHDNPNAALAIGEALEADSIRVTTSTVADDLLTLVGRPYTCVALYTAKDFLNDAHVDALASYVRAGGGLLGLHGATATNKLNPRWTKLIGGMFTGHPPGFEFTVHVSDPAHPLVKGLQDYSGHDELYTLDMHDTVHTFLTAPWEGKTHPLGWTKTDGQGRVVYLASGHSATMLRHPTVSTLIARGARFAGGEVPGEGD
jgi:type 1 glutamine amidotransferase